jgi:hypothetical protein
VDPDRLARILAALDAAGGADADDYPTRVCEAAVRLLGVTGAGLVLMTTTEPAATWSSQPLVAQIEDLQFALGEGPGADAFRLGAPVMEPDLSGPGTDRWPAFGRAALDLGIRAIFSLPLSVGVICVGVLDLCRDRAGALSDDQLADALVLADVATRDVIDLQARGSLGWRSTDAAGDRTRVHQATGMIAAQLNSDMATALARLRGHAYASGHTINDVAESVLARDLRFQ